MYDVNLTLCSKTDPVIPYFLSVFLLKSFQLALHFSSVVLPCCGTKGFFWKEFQHFQPLSWSKFIPSEYWDVDPTKVTKKDRIWIVSSKADNCFYNTLIISNHRWSVYLLSGAFSEIENLRSWSILLQQMVHDTHQIVNWN